jgi:hypothetical protein
MVCGQDDGIVCHYRLAFDLIDMALKSLSNAMERIELRRVERGDREEPAFCASVRALLICPGGHLVRTLLGEMAASVSAVKQHRGRQLSEGSSASHIHLGPASTY